jgi:hypothetical protein
MLPPTMQRHAIDIIVCYMPRSANSTSAADNSASRVPVDLSERAVRAAVIAPVNTAPAV